MGKRLEFIGWERPVIRSVVEYLLPRVPAEPPDFSRTVIVVPTRQAGRRLRQALAARCAEGGTGLLGLRVQTPSTLLEGSGKLPDAPPMLIKAVWMMVLKAAGLDAFPALLPIRMNERTVKWRVQTGAILQRLREQLAENGLTLADVPLRAGDLLIEADRWRDLVRLEAGFLAALETTGMGDPCRRQCDLPSTAVPPPDTDVLILAGVPDPPDLVLAVLDRLSPVLDVRILVHAPPEEADSFDDWGRPLPAVWLSRPVDIPDAGQSVSRAADPADQARRVLAELDAHAVQYAVEHVAVGVPDPEVAPSLEQAFSERGIRVFDPSETPVSRHPTARLLALLHDLALAPIYRTIADLLRHRDVLSFLASRHAIGPDSLLRELDQFQNLFLPQDLDAFTDVRLEGREPIPDVGRPVFPALSVAVRLVREWRTRLPASDSPAGGLRAIFQSVYDDRLLSGENPADRAFSAAAAEINAVLTQLDDAWHRTGRLDRDEALGLMAESLEGRPLPVDREGADVALEGWLELPWNPAPFLLITGLNEGRVPDSRLGDLFLPDSLRSHLGLRHDARRLARDLFLFRTLIASRRPNGLLRLFCGKTSSAGDPLKPSRLLFQCRPDELPDRAARLFAPLPDASPTPPATVSFTLSPVLPKREIGWPPGRPVSVTAFQSFLDCPFRFYLRHVLGMEAMDDLETEPHAREFGTLIHRALRVIYENESLRTCTDEQRLRNALTEAAGFWMRQRYAEPWPLPIRIVYEAAINRLSAAARCQAAEAAAGWTILAIEQAWSLPMAGLVVKGKADRIDYHPASDTIRILDYKTGKAGTPCQKAHLASWRDDVPPHFAANGAAKPSRWIDLQLPLYAVLWGEHPLRTARHLQVGYFLLPPSLDDTGVQIWEGFSPELADSARHCAEGICLAIRENAFWPPADRPRYDDFGPALGGDLAALFRPFKNGRAS